MTPRAVPRDPTPQPRLPTRCPTCAHSSPAGVTTLGDERSFPSHVEALLGSVRHSGIQAGGGRGAVQGTEAPRGASGASRTRSVAPSDSTCSAQTQRQHARLPGQGGQQWQSPGMVLLSPGPGVSWQAKHWPCEGPGAGGRGPQEGSVWGPAALGGRAACDEPRCGGAILLLPQLSRAGQGKGLDKRSTWRAGQEAHDFSLWLNVTKTHTGQRGRGQRGAVTLTVQDTSDKQAFLLRPDGQSGRRCASAGRQA